jgi:hypothetical protein
VQIEKSIQVRVRSVFECCTAAMRSGVESAEMSLLNFGLLTRAIVWLQDMIAESKVEADSSQQLMRQSERRSLPFPWVVAFSLVSPVLGV